MTHSEETPRLAGTSFSLYPMSDAFVPLITNALKSVDSSKVWMQTDAVSTIVRGRMAHIFDVTVAAFLQVAKEGVHTILSGSYSIGCPGDSEGHSFMAEDDQKCNRGLVEAIEQPVVAKFALYPMGGGDYMDLIYRQIEAMKTHGVEVTMTHYETMLSGDARDVFRGLEAVFAACEAAGSPHTVMTVTISANSPSVD